MSGAFESIPIESIQLQNERFVQMDQMVEEAFVEKPSQELYKSFQYQSEDKKPKALPHQERPALPGAFPEGCQECPSLTCLKSLKEPREDHIEVNPKLERQHERQKNHSINLAANAREEIQRLPKEATKSKNLRVEESLDIVQSVLQTDSSELFSLYKIARSLAFIAGVIARLDLLFQLYRDDSPLKDWLQHWGFPEDVAAPLRASLAGVLLGQNASGFEQGQFQGVVQAEDLAQIFSRMTSMGDQKKLSIERFAISIETFINEIIEYMSEELEKSEKALQLLKFILSLLMLLLLLVIEHIFLEEEKGQQKSSEGQKIANHMLCQTPNQDAGGRAVQVAFQVIAKIFKKFEEDNESEAKRSENEKLEKSEAAKAISSLFSQMLDKDEGSDEQFRQTFSLLSESVNKILEQEEQAIRIQIDNSA